MYVFCCFCLLAVFGLATCEQSESDGCVLPEYPAHGAYTVLGRPAAVPGESYDTIHLTVTCDPGYGVVGSSISYCVGRSGWRQPIPRCSPKLCRLTPDPSVKYSCKIGGGIVYGTRECEELEPNGTVVVPECNHPGYYSNTDLHDMHCVEGTWDHVAVCKPDCGTSTPQAEWIIINGARAKPGEFPWHAAIYDKWSRPYKQLCGGSLISTKVVISAAHCFWNEGEGQFPPSKYAVALGKIYRPWNVVTDFGAHLSNVSEIKIPARYMGAQGHNQEDIALVIMSSSVVYTTYIRPVCVDFSVEFDEEQLQNTHSGKISGWGLTSAVGTETRELLTTELQYVEVERCMAGVPFDFKAYITSDKICAHGNGTTLCKGDSGGGLVFSHEEDGTRRYYLRGVASVVPTSPITGQKCNYENFYTAFTHIQRHATFIKDHGLGVNSPHDDGQVHVGSCVLPEYPAHGTYSVHNKQGAAPGQAYDTVVLTVTCDIGYGVIGNDLMYCFGRNYWMDPVPQCHRFCNTTAHISVNYRCKAIRDQLDGTRLCNEFEPNGTIVVPRCNGPKYEHYGVLADMHCIDGYWDYVATCEPGFCQLTPHPSVKYYYCKDVGAMSGYTRPCNEYEPSGTVAVSVCDRPNYYHPDDITDMHCDAGVWDHVTICQPECGITKGVAGRDGHATLGEVPWHAGIYYKNIRKIICGGSLVSATVVISDASCFWSESELEVNPPSKYMVALGKINLLWNKDMHTGVQRSNVSDIKIPLQYRGAETFYKDDIAILVLATPVVYSGNIRPVCLNFSVDFDTSQLQGSDLGKAAGWGLTSEDGEASPVLKNMELRIVDKETCIDKFPLDFRPYFTTDKICARPVKGVVCKGDGGGGVAFPTVDRQGIQRYYLRGVISTVPRNEHRCNVKSDMLLTHILKHENFIKTHLNKNFVSAPLGGCVLPDYPQHGTYTAHGKPDAVPGQVYDQIFLTITCDLGYGTVTTNTTFCVSDNKWSEPKPECSRFCQLTPHPSVEYYYCKDVGATSNNTRPCNEYEPSGTVAVSVCDRPNYYHPDDITDMHCDAGVWDHVTICQPECGIIKGVAGRDGHATLGEVPWHAGIYDKNIRKIICGGSLVSATVVISAASCFWSDLEGVKPPSKYMVALGKINLLWNEDMDTGVQRSNVSDITIPLQYQGAETFYKYDIAILVLATPVVYSGNIRPVCLNFSVDFDTSQLQGIDLGKAAGWGLTSENGEASPVLKNMELRIVDKKTCIKKFPLDFRSYFTTDKICARPVKGVVCKGDGGGGVAFPTVDRQGIQRYYLRGVISVKPRTELGCDVKTDFLLTYILEHENFIKTHLYPFRERL